jgi:hypothetical protein
MSAWRLYFSVSFQEESLTAGHLPPETAGPAMIQLVFFLFLSYFLSL